MYMTGKVIPLIKAQGQIANTVSRAPIIRTPLIRPPLVRTTIMSITTKSGPVNVQRVFSATPIYSNTSSNTIKTTALLMTRSINPVVA